MAVAAPLYHWAPQDRRGQIIRYGLRPRMRPTVSSVDGTGGEGWRAPYVCLAESPMWAWALSGDLHPEVPAWDLWQVWLGDSHEIRRIRNFYPRDDRRWYEVRVYDRVYKRGVLWVAERQVQR